MRHRHILVFLSLVYGIVQAQQISRPVDCGKYKGCFTLPIGCTTNCQTVVTYAFDPYKDMMKIVIKTTMGWGGFMYNNEGRMPGAQGVICAKINNQVMLLSRRNENRRPVGPTGDLMDPVPGNSMVTTMYEDGVSTCKFYRTLTVPQGSERFMYDLTSPQFAIWASGSVSGSGSLNGHGNNYAASPERVDSKQFAVPIEMKTTMQPMTTKMPMEKMISRPEGCDKYKGCFTLPMGCTTNCKTVITYAYDAYNSMVKITVQSTKGWAAVMFNNQPAMPEAQGVVCAKINNQVMLLSRRNENRRPVGPTGDLMDPVPGNTMVTTMYEDGVSTCKFYRPLTVPEGSERFMYDLTSDKYAIWASGEVSSSGQLMGHGSYYAASDMKIDITQFLIPLEKKMTTMQPMTTAPMAKTINYPAGCGLYMGCFSIPPDCTDNCQSVFTFSYDPYKSMVKITLASTRGWSSIMFNEQSAMSGIRGVVCANINNQVMLLSRRALSRSTPTGPMAGMMDPVPGNTMIKAMSMDGVNTCEFYRTLDVPAESAEFMYDLNTNRYVAWASGAIRPDGSLGPHGPGTNRYVTPFRVNIKEFQMKPNPKPTTQPDEITTTPYKMETTTPYPMEMTTKMGMEPASGENVEEFCYNRASGYYAFAPDKTKFVRCHKSRFWTFDCPTGLEWIVLGRSGTCGFPFQRKFFKYE